MIYNRRQSKTLRSFLIPNYYSMQLDNFSKCVKLSSSVGQFLVQYGILCKSEF